MDKIYEKEDTLDKFSSRLVERLYDPPYDSWFRNVNKISGGKKRKTKRKISKRRRNKMKSKRKYSRKRKMYGGFDPALAEGAASALSGVDPSANNRCCRECRYGSRCNNRCCRECRYGSRCINRC